jgi:hypothetical protein
MPTPAPIRIPFEIEEVFASFRTAEFSTIARDETPITWPTAPIYQPEFGRFFLTTCIGLPLKAFNVRRNQQVSLFFSDPTGSGLVAPPAVLVQGNAIASDKVYTWNADLVRFWRMIGERQPATRMFSSTPVMRYLADWYFMRLLIYITPRRIRWWPAGDFSQPPREVAFRKMEARHVD